MHRLPLLHHHLPLFRAAFSMEGTRSGRDQVRAVQPPAGERAEAGMHQRLSHGCRIFGPRTVLLLEAKRRIKNSPGRYYQDRVYGETDNGGTQCLYLSRVPFEKLGLPELGPESVPARTLRWQKRIYQYFALPALLYVGLVQVIRKNLAGHEQEAHRARERKRLEGATMRAQV